MLSNFVDLVPADNLAFDPSGESGAHRHHREDYTVRAETGSGLSHRRWVKLKAGFVLPKFVCRIFIKFDSSGKPLRTAPNTELLAGTIIQGTPYVAVYNNTDGAFYLQGFYGNPYNVPLGAGMDYWGPVAPNSCFVFPQGNVISTATYAALYALIGTTYNIGNEGAGMFRLPDKRGRVSMALDPVGSVVNSATMNPNGSTLGAVGGAQQSQLSTANLPPYTPSGNISQATISQIFANNVAGGGAIPSNGGNFGFTAPVVSSQTFTGSAQGGTSAAFTNLQPTIACNYILRVI